MLTKRVGKTDSLETIVNNTFVFCYDLGKGFIKRDLSLLGLTNYSFENVINHIETLDVITIDNLGLDSVLFTDGTIKISDKIEKKIKEKLSLLETEEERVTYISNSKSIKKYFDIDVEELAIYQPTTIKATGGVITEVNGYRYHQFTTSGIFDASSIPKDSTIDYIIVGGGGGGGTGTYGLGANNNGAGGGGGGVVSASNIPLAIGSYTIIVGAGGAGATGANKPGSDGTSSSAFGVVAGFGRKNNGLIGGASGFPQSKGGGAGGSYSGGGGGGAGSVGVGGGGNSRKNGGIGVLDTNFIQFGASAQSTYAMITLSPIPNGYFGGGGQGAGNTGLDTRSAGGGGSMYHNGIPANPQTNGIVNTGGGGAGTYGANNTTSGSGGSGTVIIRYKI